MESKKQRQVESLLVVMAVLGGLRVVFNKFALNYGFGPYAITAAQMLIGGGVLACYLRGKLFSLSKKYLVIAMLASIAFFLSFYLGALGLVYTTPSKNIFLTQSSMIFIPFLYFFLYKQKIDVHTTIGVLIAMMGLAVLTLDKGFGNMNIGDLLTISAAFVIAVHMTFSSFVLKKKECDPIAFTAVQMIAAGIMALFLALRAGDFSTQGSLAVGWPLLLGGLLNGLSFYANSLAFRYSTPTKMSIIYAIGPVSGMTASILFLGEAMTPRLFAGGGLIMAALLVTQLKPKLPRKIVRRSEEQKIGDLI